MDVSSGFLPLQRNIGSLSFSRSFSPTSSLLPFLRISVWRAHCSLPSTQLFHPTDSPTSSVLTLALRSRFVEDKDEIRLLDDERSEFPVGIKKRRRAGSVLDPWNACLLGRPVPVDPTSKAKKRPVRKGSAVDKESDAGIFFQSEQWEFLKQLPHQLVRDIAFVMICPSIMMDSNELPLVSKEMIGGSDMWQEAAKWLKGLDPYMVIRWFEARRYTTRVGDFYAACIEFVLTFSPLLLADPLYISQEVETLKIQKQQSLGLHKRSTKPVGCFETKDGGIMSEVIVQQYGSDVLMKRLSSFYFEKVGTIKKITDSEVEHIIDEFKPSRWNRNSVKTGDVMERIKPSQYVKGNTAGEFDFLFKVNANNPPRRSADNAWTEVHHWEVALQHLLYIGPWEAFGLVTPGFSIWNRSGKRIFAETEHLGLGANSILLETIKDGQTKPIPALDACLVGLVSEESLFVRKKRMGRQIALSCKKNSAAKITNLFNAALGPRGDWSIKRHDEIKAGNDSLESFLRGPGVKDNRQDPRIVRVIPRALTQGYLFYESKFWLALNLQKAKSCGKVSVKQTGEDIGCDWLKNFSTSCINPDHWIGWWMHASEFAEFALSPSHAKSMWYIATANEWLSPVIISYAEKERCSRVYSLVGILTIASKLAEEAAELKPPKKARFMVMEVRWDPEFCSHVISPFEADQESEKHHQCGEDLDERGAWVEVSRGFVVDESWPDSRDIESHGFKRSWSPTLLGWH